MSLRLSTLLHVTLFVFFATIVLLFLPALRSYVSTEGPVDEVREDLSQFLTLQRFTYLVERRSLESLDLVFAEEDVDELREAEGVISGLLESLRRSAEAEDEPEVGEITTLEALETLDNRLRRDTERILDLSRRDDRIALLEEARLVRKKHRQDVSAILDQASLQEGDAVNKSLDGLLAASGHFAFVPFLPLEEKTDTLRATVAAAGEASHFLFQFERLAGEYAVAAFLDTDRTHLDFEAGLTDRALAEWRLHADLPGGPRFSFTEIEKTYRLFREVGDALLATREPDQRLDVYREELEPLADTKFPGLMEAAVASYEDQLASTLEEIDEHFELAGRMIALMTAALAVLMLTSPWFLSRWVVQPIADLSEAAQALGRGDLSQRVPAHGSREVLELARSFNRTAEDLGELQERLDRQRRLAVLGELAGSIGHEIRNPLGTMKSSIFFLRNRREKTVDAKAEEHLERIERQIRRANRIITELLDYARNPMTSPRSIDLGEILDQAFENIEIPPAVHLEDREARGCPRAFADPEQIGRVVENLVQNACQAMPDGGKLRVSCGVRGSEVTVAVADTGIGIPTENLTKIFEPLVTSKMKGIGLGLPVAQRYAELNGGRIECESELGRGSLFRLILPSLRDETSDAD